MLSRFFTIWSTVFSAMAWCSHRLFSLFRRARYAYLLAFFIVSLTGLFLLQGFLYLSLIVLTLLIIFNLGINIFYFRIREEEQAVIDGLLFRKEEEFIPNLEHDYEEKKIFKTPIPDDVPRTTWLTQENERLYTTGIVIFSNIFQIIFFGWIFFLLYQIGGDRFFKTTEIPTLVSWVLFTAGHLFKAIDIIDLFQAYNLDIHAITHKGYIAGSLVIVFKFFVDALLIKAISQHFGFQNRMQNTINALGVDAENAKLRCKRIGKRIVPFLIAALSDENPKVRAGVAEIVGRMKVKNAAKPLATLLGDEDENVRKHTVKALEFTGDSSLLTQVLPCLEDSDLSVQFAAIKTLGKFGDVRALEHLQRLYAKSDEQMQQLIIEAVEHIIDEKTITFLKTIVSKTSGTNRRKAISNWVHVTRELDIAKFNENLTQYLTQLLVDPKAEDRDHAIFHLTYIRGKEMKETLIKLLEDADIDVQVAAIEALGDLDEPSCLPLLQKKLENENKEVRIAAQDAVEFLSESTSTSKSFTQTETTS